MMDSRYETEMNIYQQKIFDAQMFFEEPALSNIGGVLSFDVDIKDFEVKVIAEEIVHKTDVLNLRLNENNVLYLCDDKKVNLEIVNDIQNVKAYLDDEMSVPFEIYDAPLYDIKIINLVDKVMIFFKMHHILGDSFSISIFLKLVEEGYNSIRDGKKYICKKNVLDKKTETEKNIYLDASEKVEGGLKQSEGIRRAEEYFDRKLGGYELKKLAHKNSRKTEADYMSFEVPLSKSHITTEFISAMYIYMTAVLDINKYSFGFVLGNRNRKNMDTIGMFANTLPLVIDYEGDLVEELEKHVKTDIFKLLRHGSYSSEKLRDSSIYEISISYRIDDFVPTSRLGTVTELFSGFLDVPIRIDAMEKDGRLKFKILYRKDLYDAFFIKNMGEGLLKVLGQIMTGSERISDIDILTDYDRTMYKALNDTTVKHHYKDVIDCFMDHKSDESSLVWKDGSLTGEELYENGLRIAKHLRYLTDSSNGYITNHQIRVGIDIKRSPEMIEAALGCLIAGASFLILSDTIPQAKKFVDVIIDSDMVQDILSGDTDNINKIKEFFDTRMYEYDSDDTAYMVFTSGSTGEPKCIEISRNSLISRLEWQNSAYGLCGNILQKTVNTFDVSVWEMFSFIFGAKLCLLPAGDEKYPDRIAQAIQMFEINKVHFVPSMLRIFIDYVNRENVLLPSLKEVYASGERLDSNICKSFFESFENVRLVNFYGPAECTIDVLHHECKPGEKEISIGHPVDNTNVRIVSRSGRILPVGVCGEIQISGELVGKGYLMMGEKGEIRGVPFNEMFEKNHAEEKNSFYEEAFYNTGDTGMLSSDGNIYFYGRNDNQVKLRGMKVSLSGIRDTVMEVDGLCDAEVLYEDDRLECYYIGNADINEIKKHIAENISAYAVPSLFRKVDHFPMNNNQKLDRKKLREMGEAFQERKTDSGNKLLQDVYDEVSHYIEASYDDNLFRCGLDSLTVIKITNALQDKGYDISFSDFYENLTIREIAKNVNNKKYYTYLKKVASDSVLICFPFAGGEPQNFEKLAASVEMDVIGVYVSSFPEKASIQHIAKKMVKTLPINGYKHIYIYGHCVGSYIALEYASRLKKTVDRIFLVAPSLKTGTTGKHKGIRKKAGNKNLVLSPWRIMDDRMIAGFLIKSGSRYKYSRHVIRRFRTDTDRFFRYNSRVLCFKYTPEISVVFGTKDIFTINQKSIIRYLQKLFGMEHVTVYRLKGEKHFMNDTAAEKLGDIITK